MVNKTGNDVKIPWKDDELSRHECAKFLTSYLTKRFGTISGKKGEDSFVLNINSSWGFGKSYFLENWKIDLENSGYPVIYYDAWKNDFSDEPLLGFISELESSLGQLFKRSTKARRHAESIVASAKRLLRPALPLLLAALTKKFTNMTFDELMHEVDIADCGVGATDNGANSSNSSETLSKVIEKAAEQALKEHKTKQKYIAEFRVHVSALVDYIAKSLSSTQLPIFVMVDELDRCRPTYAIELLENIKHIFGVPGMCFIVATDSKQLAASVKAVYGSEFDAERYLQRFFDQEYVLPDPDYIKYANFLFSTEEFQSGKIINLIGSGSETSQNVQLFANMSKVFGLTLRGQNQCFEMFRAIYLMWNSTERIHLPYLLFLIFLRHARLEAFVSYLSNPLGSEWENALDKRVINSKIFSVMKWVDDSRFQKKSEKISFKELISEYSDLSARDIRTVMRYVGNVKLIFAMEAGQELLNCGEFTEENNPLRKYAILVRQAGQLI